MTVLVEKHQAHLEGHYGILNFHAAGLVRLVSRPELVREFPILELSLAHERIGDPPRGGFVVDIAESVLVFAVELLTRPVEVDKDVSRDGSGGHPPSVLMAQERRAEAAGGEGKGRDVMGFDAVLTL